jgi:all-trans-retinol 13,14-reductase
MAGVSCANGERFEATGCIVTLHPQAMLQMVPGRVFRPVYRRRLNGLAETAGADIVFLRCERQRGSSSKGRCERQCENLLAGHNFFFLPPSGTDDLLDLGLSLKERLLYLNFAGSGGFPESQDCGITAILPAPPGSGADSSVDRRQYDNKKAETGELVRERIARLQPELAGLRVECVATTKTLQRINLSPKGSLYGVKHMVGQFNPTPRTRLANFYLAGQAVAAPGLLGAITSALLAVGEVVGHEKVQTLRSEVVCDG